MSAVSAEPTKVSTSARTPAHLESIETANFETGDIAWVESVRRYYVLDKLSRLIRDGINVLYTKNASPRMNGGNSGPGRWILWVPEGPPGATGATGAPGATGPAGPTGATGPAAPTFFTDLVYRPGDPTPDNPNTYTDWATLVAAANLVDGPKTIFFSDQFAPIVIPPGLWDFGLGATTFLGSPRDLAINPPNPQPLPVVITVADGALLTGVHYFANVLLLVQNSNTAEPVMRVTRESGDANLFEVSGLGGIVIQGAGDFVWVDTPATGAFFTKDFSNIASAPGAGVALRAVVAASQAVVIAFDGSNVGANTFGGIAGTFVIGLVASAAASIDVNQDVPGGVIPVQYLGRASAVSYDGSAAPFINANTVQEAIDRLKSLPAQSQNSGGVPIGNVDTPLVTLPTLVAPIFAPVLLDATVGINDAAPGNDVNFFFERSLDGGTTWNSVSNNYVQTTLANNTVSWSARDFVSAGDNVIYRAVARANSGAPNSTAIFMQARMVVEGP